MSVPEFLYKYMTADTAKIVLETGRLRWQSPCQFNDVNELQKMPLLEPSFNDGWKLYSKKLVEMIYHDDVINFTIYAPWTQIILTEILQYKVLGYCEDRTLGLVENKIPSLKNDIEQVLRTSTEVNNDGSLRFYCLSEDENNNTMWGYYGEGHLGCMFEFGHIEELSTPFHEAEKVSYSNEPVVVGSALDILLYGPSAELKKNTRLAIYFHKTNEWANEKEWRVMVKRPNPNDEMYTDFKFYPKELTSITFGARILDVKKLEIMDVIRDQYPHCKIFQMSVINGTSQRVEVEG